MYSTNASHPTNSKYLTEYHYNSISSIGFYIKSADTHTHTLIRQVKGWKWYEKVSLFTCQFIKLKKENEEKKHMKL